MADEKLLTVVKSEPLPTLTVMDAQEAAPAPEEKKYGTGTIMSAAAQQGRAAFQKAVESAWKFAASPTARQALQVAPETGSLAAQGVAGASGLATAGGLLASGNPLAAGETLLATGPAVWMAGRGGWHTAKLANRVTPGIVDAAQKATLPIIQAAGRAQPYVEAGLKALGKLGGAQTVLDLAQMAEPNRKDIGFLGIGTESMPDLEILTKAVAKGANPASAAAAITHGDAKRFGALMTAYMQARQVKP